jgi:hypothetical protein
MKSPLVLAGLVLLSSPLAFASTVACSKPNFNFTAKIIANNEISDLRLVINGHAQEIGGSFRADANYAPRNPAYANYNRFSIDDSDMSSVDYLILPRDLGRHHEFSAYEYTRNFDAEGAPEAASKMHCALINL